MAAKVERGSTLPSTCNLVNASHRSTIQSFRWHMQRIKKSHITQKNWNTKIYQNHAFTINAFKKQNTDVSKNWTTK